MSDIKSCEHLNKVIDEHEGTLVCISCGLVVDDQLLINYDKNYSDEKTNQDNFESDSFKEYLSRLNLSESALNSFNQSKTKNLSSIASNLYITINQSSSVSLKEILSVTGANEKQIVKQTRGHTTILKKEILLEKYCNQLELDFKIYTLIKELLEKLKITGHNPLTLIASCIYFTCKKLKLKLSMKKISNTVGISCISIQRFLNSHKNELSHGI